MGQISILIIDDHLLVRETWNYIFQSDARYNVIGSVESGKEGIRLATDNFPDIVLMDINLPDMSGIEATEHILKVSPNSKILAVSLHIEPVYAKQIFSKGASGYLTKSSSKEEMLIAVDEILKGNKYICNEIKEIIADRVISDPFDGLQLLTARELQVAEEISRGLTSKKIAEKLNLSVKTVDVHRYKVLKKLKLPNMAALINYMNKYYFK